MIDSIEKDGIVCIFHWGFPTNNRPIFFLIKDNQSVKIEVKEGIHDRRVVLQ